MFPKAQRIPMQYRLTKSAFRSSLQSLVWVAGIALLMSNTIVFGAVTSDDVFREALILERQIDLLREATNNTHDIKKPQPQKNKSPVHVYAKSLEVREKIAAVQKLYGLETIDSRSIPSSEIAATDVLNAVVGLTTAMSTVLQSHNLIDPTGRSIATGNTPNEVYEKLWLISNSLDTFIGPIQPSSVHVSVTHALIGVKQIAQKINVEIPDLMSARAGVDPKDVNIEGYRNLYRLGKLQRELGLSTIPVGTFPIGSITPADVYDTTNIILAELSRLRVRLKIPSPSYEKVNAEVDDPAVVLVQMQQIGQISNLLIKKLKAGESAYSDK